MPVIRNIDIRGVDWPICILTCKKEVDQMETGERIDILADDIDVVKNLIALLSQLPNYRIQKQSESQYYKLIIKKNTRNI